MAERSADDQVRDRQSKIEQLQKEIEELQHPKLEYPKYIMDKDNTSQGRIVNTPEEEAAVKGGKAEGEMSPVSADAKDKRKERLVIEEEEDILDEREKRVIDENKKDLAKSPHKPGRGPAPKKR